VTFCYRIFLLLAFILVRFSVETSAQFIRNDVPINFREGQEANLFFEWQGRETVQAFQVSLPKGLRLNEAFFIPKSNPHPQPAQIRFAGRQVIITPRTLFRGGYTLVLRTIPEYEGNDFLEITPIRLQETDKTQPHEKLLFGLSQRREVQITRSFVNSSGKALLFGDRLSKPLEIRRSALPSLHPSQASTVSFWIKTVDLNAVILTTWNGNDFMAYPLEMRIDAFGHLQTFRGQPGFHESLVSPKPIADGQWHHVGMVNNPQARKTYLVVNGVFVDSLLHRMNFDTSGNSLNLMVGMRPGANTETSFQGSLQELMFWSRARTAKAIRSTMLQSISWNSEGLVRIPFDDTNRDILAVWPQEVRRVASDLLLRYPIQDLSVVQRASSVFLSWRSQQNDTRMFEVERSTDGLHFERLAAISKEEGIGFENGRTYSFNDYAVLSEGVLYYRVKQYFTDGAERYSGLIKVGRGQGEEPVAELIGNSPNPFNPQTRISYQLRQAQTVELTVWSIAGNLVGTLVNFVHQPQGIYYVDFNGSDWPSGTYLVRLQTESTAQVIKIVLAK